MHLLRSISTRFILLLLANTILSSNVTDVEVAVVVVEATATSVKAAVSVAVVASLVVYSLSFATFRVYVALYLHLSAIPSHARSHASFVILVFFRRLLRPRRCRDAHGRTR